MAKLNKYIFSYSQADSMVAVVFAENYTEAGEKWENGDYVLCPAEIAKNY